jgi:hypothetical protein
LGADRRPGFGGRFRIRDGQIERERAALSGNTAQPALTAK